MIDMSNRKRMIGMVCSTLGVLIFAYCYFIRAQEVWSWPVALCLGVTYGLVVLWIFRHNKQDSAKTQNQKNIDDTVA